jgi:hypothetical protein
VQRIEIHSHLLAITKVEAWSWKWLGLSNYIKKHDVFGRDVVTHFSSSAPLLINDAIVVRSFVRSYCAVRRQVSETDSTESSSFE